VNATCRAEHTLHVASGRSTLGKCCNPCSYLAEPLLSACCTAGEEEFRRRYRSAQPGDEKGLGRPWCRLPVAEGDLQEKRTGTFDKGM